MMRSYSLLRFIISRLVKLDFKYSLMWRVSSLHEDVYIWRTGISEISRNMKKVTDETVTTISKYEPTLATIMALVWKSLVSYSWKQDMRSSRIRYGKGGGIWWAYSLAVSFEICENSTYMIESYYLILLLCHSNRTLSSHLRSPHLASPGSSVSHFSIQMLLVSISSSRHSDFQETPHSIYML